MSRKWRGARLGHRNSQNSGRESPSCDTPGSTPQARPPGCGIPGLRHPQVAEGQAVEFRAVHFQRLLNFHRGWVFHDGGLGSGCEGCGAVRVVEGPVVIGVLPCRIVPAHALHRRRRNPAVVCTSDVVDPVEKDRCAGPSCRLSINSRRRRAAPDVRLTAVRGMRDRPGRTG